MNRPNPILSSTVIDYCKRCSDDERSSIVAYCCHLTFSDKSVRRTEVEFVRAIAKQMGVSPKETGKMARKARRHRLKIRTPKSRSGRNLLFHLALRMAVADARADVRERMAIDRLASKLRISPDTVDKEMQKLQKKTSPAPDATVRQPVATSSDSPQPASTHGDGSAPSRLESLNRDLVAETLQADLFEQSPVEQSPVEQGSIQDGGETLISKGEMEYTLTPDGDVELEIELDGIDLPVDETLAVIIAGQHVCDLVIPMGPIEKTIRAKRHEFIPEVALGNPVEVHYRQKPILGGVFRAT